MTRFTSKGIHVIKVGNHLHKNMLTKSENVRGGYKWSIPEMHLHLKTNNLKQSCVCIHTHTPVSQHFAFCWQVQTKKKSIIDTQIRKSNPNTTLKKVIKPQEKGRKKTNKSKSKTINKMAISTYQ